jgi:hypothetical protein
MKAILAILVSVLAIGAAASAQQPTPTTTPATPAPAQTEVDPRLHADVLKLLELVDLRSKMIEAQKNEMPAAKEKMLQIAPGMSDEFFNEWSRRMLADPQIDLYIDAIAAVYEKHFNAEEIEEMIKGRQDVIESKTPSFSDALKAKLEKDSVAVQSEIMGACAQIGSKHGGEIGQQIVKEHPEWVKETSATKDKPATK